MKEIHTLGLVVHGALLALHGLGLVYNIRRRNRLDVVVHSLALYYEFRSVRTHYKQMR